jgi:hypothetical protein
VTADAGYHSDTNVQYLKDENIPSLIADNQMRSRDERLQGQQKHKAKGDPLSENVNCNQTKPIKIFRPADFRFNDDNTATCPAGKLMTSSGSIHHSRNGLPYQCYVAKASDCQSCEKSQQCLRVPLKFSDGKGRQVAKFALRPVNVTNASEQMRQAIDSPRGRQLYSQRLRTVEPVFANLRHNKRLTRFNHRGNAKVNTEWNLYCMVHNIEKLAKTTIGIEKRQ